MVWSLYIASLKEYTRDRMTLFWTLAFPVLFIVIFGLIFSGSGGTSYTVALVNLDTGSSGQQMVAAFNSDTAKKYLSVKNASTVADQNHYQDQLKQGKIDMVIVLPPNLSQNISAAQPTNVQLYLDSSKQTQAQIMTSIVSSFVNSINDNIPGRQPLLTVSQVSVNTTTLNSIDYLVPGILAMSLMQLGLFGTALPLVSLRERKILRRLGATPLPRSAVLLSQVLLRLTISIFQIGIIVGIGYFAFGVSIAHPLTALLIAILGALMFISIGYLIASLARTQDSANGITQAVNFPMLFLSGIFFPLAALPSFLSVVVKALPLTYLADAMRQTMINSTPDFPLTTDILVVATWLVVCGFLSVRLFRWE
jgi:ABC-2 type transport system permease protein